MPTIHPVLSVTNEAPVMMAKSEVMPDVIELHEPPPLFVNHTPACAELVVPRTHPLFDEENVVRYNFEAAPIPDELEVYVKPAFDVAYTNGVMTPEVEESYPTTMPLFVDVKAMSRNLFVITTGALIWRSHVVPPSVLFNIVPLNPAAYKVEPTLNAACRGATEGLGFCSVSVGTWACRIAPETAMVIVMKINLANRMSLLR